MKNLPWLHDLQNFAGVVIGLILLSIGSVMFLNAGAKLYIFGHESSSYFSAEDQCQNEIFPIEKEEKLQKKTPQEIEKCIETKSEQEKKRYTRNKQDDMVDGFILIIVGFPLWFFHRKRKENIAEKK